MSLNRLGPSGRVCSGARRSSRLLTRVGHLISLPFGPKAAKPLSLCATLLYATIAASAAAETTTATEYANGCTGTDGASPCAGNRIDIATLAQLRRLSERSQDWVSGWTVVLTADIDAADTSTWNAGAGFLPIGRGGVDFRGTFDGDGHTISNLTVINGTRNTGLFSKTASALIRDVGVTNVNITGTQAVGGMVGFAVNTRITRSFVEGTVKGDINVGGLVGEDFAGTITSSYARAAIPDSSSPFGLRKAGGLVGFARDSYIANSYAAGTLTDSISASDVGGLVGLLKDDTSSRQPTIITSYWDIDASERQEGVGGTEGSPTNAIPIGRNSEQMRQQASFGGFKFDGVPPDWVIIEGKTQPYFYWRDDDSDGIPAYQDLDDDGDDSPDTVDAFPLNGAASVDTDGDGLPDDWNTGCDDACQTASGLTLDNDDDNDQVDDNVDLYPLDGSRSTLPTAPGNSEEPGSADNPYLINDLADLEALSRAETLWGQSKHFKLTKNIDASDTSTWNVGDHDNDGLTAAVPMGFSPIGSELEPFAGFFDGAGYVISNLTVNRPGTGRVGLFGTTNSAVIKNIGLVDAAIEGNGSVGGLVGYDNDSTAITNSHVSGTVTGNDNWVGGLIGYTNVTSIGDSYTTAAISSSSNSVGGLVGSAETVYVINSYATGTTTGVDRVGGLVGYARQSSEVTTSYATGDVNGVSRVGGLVGQLKNNGLISAAYATGAVSGTSGSGGGLVGQADNSSITTSYATGAVSGGSGKAGGLVGYATNQSSFTNNSYWDTETSGQSEGVGGTDGTLKGEVPTGLSSDQMLDKANFGDFKFVADPPGDPINNTPWVMIDGSTQPYLYWQDDDGDGIPAYLDTDDDEDGSPDTVDAFPLISLGGRADTDGDGLPDNCDDQCQQAGMTADDDDDNDNVPDGQDVYPVDPSRSTFPTASETDPGSESNPYLINDLSGLEGLSRIKSFWGQGTHFKLISDIDASSTVDWNAGAGFSPIGNNAQPFRGTFDGAGHTISGLTIKRQSSDHVGLFGYISGFNQVIKNVGLASVNIKGGEGLDQDTGGLVGWIQGSSKVTASYVTGTVSGYSAGGLVGFSSGGTIEASHATVSITVTGDSGTGGGLVGRTNGGRIESSYATGAVEGGFYAGGLVGYDSSITVTDSYATGAVVAGRPGADTGGLLGRAEGTDVIASYATGAVSGGQNVGGLVGLANNRNPNSPNPVKIIRSFATGTVTTSSNGTAYLGGLVGRANETAGSCDGTGFFPCVVIRDSYATGVVTATKVLGGLLGYSNGVNITASYATGAVRDTYLNQTGVGGGLVGRVSIEGDGTGGSTTKGNITDSYWNKVATGQEDIYGEIDQREDGEPIKPKQDTAVGLDNNQMRKQASFKGFDFVGEPEAIPAVPPVWVIIEDETQPYLYWQDPDNDKVLNTVDQCVSTPEDEVGDVNADGCGPSERDTDGDGVNDNLDGFPEISLGERIDTDGDGRPDDCDADCQDTGMSADPDDDNDLIDDGLDDFPLNAAASVDTDGDGLPDDWNTACDQTCIDQSQLTLDLDDDNDGVSDSDEVAAGTDPLTLMTSGLKLAWLNASELTVKDCADRSDCPNPIVIPATVTTYNASGDPVESPVVAISEQAFTFSGNPSGIFLPEGLQTIGGSSFLGNYGSSTLRSLTIPSTVSTIESSAFRSAFDHGNAGTLIFKGPRPASLAADAFSDNVPAPDDDPLPAGPGLDWIGYCTGQSGWPGDPVQVGDDSAEADPEPNAFVLLTPQPDCDGDRVLDADDAFDNDPNESADSDGDGLGDNADQCDNTLAAETGQVNIEGCGPSERDTDGDGVNDNLDAFPNNPNETLDSDGDGYGDNEEISEGTDPNDPDDQPIQSGLPIWLLYEATRR